METATGRLLAERFRIETPEPLTPNAMARAVEEMVAKFKWRGRIGIGFPGVVHGTRTVTAPNLHPRFTGCDTGGLFAKATGCNVAMVNDADAAGLAEMRFGAGCGIDGPVLLLTLGTGVGTAVFTCGVLYPNSEFGHLPMRGKSAERFVSAAARKRRGLEWSEWGPEFGAYLRTLEMLLSPELIIIGGGVSAKSRKWMRYVKTRAKLVPAAFHNEAGIVGAALWAAERRLSS